MTVLLFSDKTVPSCTLSSHQILMQTFEGYFSQIESEQRMTGDGERGDEKT